MKHIIFFLILFSSSLLHAQINSGGRHGKASHNKQIIGYVPQWDAWKGNSFGYSNKGVLNQLNLDYSQYTILNFSFFGVAKDGSLHSADLRNKQIYQSGTVQEPGEMLMKDVYSSWDYWILFGEIKPTWFIDAQAKAAGYEADGNGWKNAAQGISGAPFPIPLKKSGGPKGLIDLSHENGVKCLASIGGWSMSKHFATMAADPTMRATFIADCKKLIALGFDGIDIDWEFPGPFSGMNFRGSQADFANFTTLVTELRSAIGANKIISAAFNQSATKLNGFEWAKLDKQMDYFNIMSYDVHGGWSNVAGHNSPLFDYTNQEGGSASWNDTITALSNHGVNLNKVTMGMAFYGRGVVTDGNGALHAPTIKSNRLVQPDGPISTAADFTSWPTFEGVPYYTRIKNNFQGWTKHWDNEAMVPYLTKNGAFLSYDDPRSIGLKAKYVRDNNIGGVIVWTAFGDTEPGAVDSGSTKLPRSSTTKSPLINVVNNVFAGETIPGETLATSYISVASNNINEGNSGTSQLPFTISLSAPSNGSVSVNYTTSNGTALAGNDYTQSSGTVTFAKGETTKTVNIPVLGDSTTEINEHFTLTLSSATGSRLAIKSATGTILNDDNVTPTPKTPPTGTVAPTPPNLTITGTTVLEGNSGTSNAAATITLSKASTKTITADWVASNGTASAGIDYKAAMGTIIFSPGETSKSINIQIIGDTNNEPDETIALTLRNPNGATISTAMASITITNDDQTNPTTVTTNTTVRGLSTLASNRPIVMGYVNTLRSATGHEQTLSSTQIASEVKAIHWAGYDVIVHAFGEPIDSNGSLGESLGNFSAYQQSIISEAHTRNKSVILSIGGAYPARIAGQFHEIATNATKRANFIANVVNYISTKGYDGVDIDWEFPDVATGKPALTTLMKELYAAVKAKNNDYIVMFGTGPAYYMGGYDFAKLKDHADFFFYFGYDWKRATPSGANGPIKQPGSGAQWTNASDKLYEKSVRGGIQYVLDAGFPANKIICGLPFYGSNNISWSAVRDTWAADIAGYDAAIDPDAMEVKINNVWYTTPTAMKMKMNALLKSSSSVLNNQATIRGVGTWEIGHEHKSHPDLSKAFEEWISDYSGSPILPKLNVSDISIAEKNSGTTDLRFTVTLDRSTSSNITVDYATSDGTATSSIDYLSANGTLTFSPGETTKTVAVTVSGDTNVEQNETVIFTLSNVSSNALINTSSATGTILNDDNAAPSPKTPPTGTVAPTPPNLTITGTTILEGNSGTSNATATITLSKASTKTITADWVASNGTASAGIDYKAAMGTIIFSPGETSKSINIQIIGDTNNEPDETIALTLRNPNGATISTAMASITITNDDQTNPTTVTTNTTVRGLSTLASNRPIVMGYVNALRSATGHEQTLSSAQIASEVKAIHWAGYDVIVHAFGEPIDSNGSLGESLGNFSAYQQSIISEAHTRNKSVILSIGGAYPARIAGQFHKIATNATKRANFIANVVNYISTKGYDGVDIDWEFPDVATGKPALTTLMKELYAAVKAKNNDYIVMFGTGPAYYMGGYDFAKLKDHADFFFYFGYDWKRATPSGANGPIKQPGSGAQWTNASDKLYEKSVRGGIQYVLDAGFPANKIICGLPFYGSNNISWSAVRDTWAADIAGYDAAIDPDAMEVKINNVWYTTPTAMKMKMNALLKSSSSVLNNQATIRGVGTWEIGHEHKSHPDLSKAFEEWIADYSGSPILPKLNVSNISVSEGNSATADLRFTVTIDRSASSTITVDYATSDGSATSSVDYLPANGTLTFAPGETTKTVTVTVSSDTNVEQNETVIFTLSNVSSNALINNAIATGTILDDDSIPLPSLTIAGTTIPEGNSGITNGSANITLSQSSTEAITVAWATSDGTASAGSDYTAASGTLTFAPGETSKSINIEIIGDTDNESDETITLTLRNPIKATLSKEISVITITNDDQAKVVDPSGWEHHYEGGNNAIDVAYTTPTGAHLWSSGFSGNIKVTNNGPDLENWAITFDAPWTTTGSGNAGSWSIKNGHHTITQPTWGGYKLTSGSEINIDFTGSGTWSEPTNFKFNGEELKEPNPNNVTLETWKTNNKITDLTADSNNNQLPDLIDFLTGNDLSTRAIDSTDILTPMLKILEINGKKDTYFCVALNVNPLAAGVEYRLEVSNDLVTWEGGRSQMLLYKTTTNADGRTHAIWRAASPIPNDPELQTFTRLIARVVSKSNTNTGSTGTGTPGNGGDSTNNNNDNSGTGSTSTTGPKGSPNAPSVSIQKDWTDGRGHKINWNTWGGEAATEWKLYQNGKLIHTGTITGKAPQTASYDYDLANIGSFTYTVELTNSVGSSTSKPSTFLTDFASPMNLKGQDTTSQVSQVTINAGVNTLTVEGGKTPYTVTVNHPAAISATVAGQTITINGTAGMRSGLKIIDADGAIRLIGVRVKNADGSLPGLPNYLSIGSVSEDSKPDLDFFADYQPNTRKNKWVDYRYIYINGGVKRKNVGWRTWTAPKDGERMRKFVRESIKRGMLPVIVWYNIPDGGEAYTTDLQHMQEEDYMQGYFEDLKFAIDIANEEAGDEMVLWVLEPDFIGYMAQNNEDPMTLMAKTDAAYSVGVLDTAAGDPLFPNTMRGLIESINYTLKKHSNNAYIGWQFNLWAFPAGGWVKGSKVGVKGLMRITDTQGMTAGRQTVRNEGLAVADYYTRCGILTHGADFISIDKYGLDAGSELKNDNPEASTWFWNAEHWGNYLYYCSALHERTGKNVMLWQLTIGHVNSSQLTSPYTNTLFPDHPNSPRDWEDSAPTFFFGDTFKPGAGNRYNWFSQNKGGYSDVTLNADGETITWGSHMKAARDAGVHIMLFGDGVGNSTRGRGDSNTDDFWWITATQDYYANPVPLKP